ncbi:MAG: hypothetical protein M1839_003206 [Geoglossum umbratile]|nr:MAG: hypothetical protein M1839_003206 [Geoglossum umbratile]
MKGGNAAPRDATAKPAWEQELQDVDHHPDFRDGPTVIRKIGRWANHVKHRFSGRDWNTPHENLNTDNPDRYTQTFEYKNWKVRMDKFPWLDLADKRTINNSPFKRRIVKHMAFVATSSSPSDDGYLRYLAEDEKECPLYKQALLVYGERLEHYNQELAEHEAHIQAGTMRGEPQPKRKRRSTKETNSAAKPPPKKPSPPKKPDPTTKVSRKNWLEYQTSLAETEALLESVMSGYYDCVPEDYIYIARDCKDRVILAVFPRGLEFAYGSKDGQRCADALANNIEKYTESQPPPTVLDCRHAHHKWWLKQDGNEHFRPPKGRCGVYHWGTWFEQGQTERGPIWSKDYRAGGTHSGVSDGAYAVRLRQQLMWSLGNMTRAVDLLFRIVDNPMREQYHAAWQRLLPAVRVSTTENEPFTLRAVLINVLTEAHIDCNDWENGWAWIGVLGDFNDGDLCMPQLGIRVPMPAGSITGMRGRDLEHFIAKWSGRRRYSVVHSFWDSIRHHVGIDVGPYDIANTRRKEDASRISSEATAF